MRVVIVGANGAGKTWFAHCLAYKCGLPVIGKDQLALLTGWQQRPREEVRTKIATWICNDAWVLEGGPSLLTAEVLDRADVVIWLDLPAYLRFWRIMLRSLRYLGRVRPEHPPGNRDWPGLRQWRFAWRALTRGKEFSLAIQRALSGAPVEVLHLTSRREARHFLGRV